MTSKDKALIVAPTYAIESYANPAEMLLDALAPGESFSLSDLPRIKVPVGGGLAWELPGGEPAREFEAVILHRQLSRAFWNDEFSGEGSPPDCRSDDNIHGVGLWGVKDGVVANGNPNALCKECPMAAWGSGKGNAQACRQNTSLYLLFPDMVFPVVLNVPPSSFSACHDYIVRDLTAFGIDKLSLTTKFSMVTAKSKPGPDGQGGGISYSQIRCERGTQLTPDLYAKMKAYRDGILPAITPVAG